MRHFSKAILLSAIIQTSYAGSKTVERLSKWADKCVGGDSGACKKLEKQCLEKNNANACYVLGDMELTNYGTGERWLIKGCELGNDFSCQKAKDFAEISSHWTPTERVITNTRPAFSTQQPINVQPMINFLNSGPAKKKETTCTFNTFFNRMDCVEN